MTVRGPEVASRHQELRFAVRVYEAMSIVNFRGENLKPAPGQGVREEQGSVYNLSLLENSNFIAH